MRVCATKIPLDLTVIESINHKYEVEDTAMVADVMALLLTEGDALISKAQRFKKLAQMRREPDSVQRCALLIRKYDFMYRIKQMRLFKQFCKVAKENTIEEATDRLIALIRAANRKMKITPCIACQLLAKCPHGMFLLGKNMVDGKPHGECPLVKKLPTQPFQQLQNGLQVLKELCDPNMLAMLSGNSGTSVTAFMLGLSKHLNNSPGKKDVFDSTFTGRDVMEKMAELVDGLTAQQLAVFEIGRTLDSCIKKGKSRKLETSQAPNKENRLVNMQTHSELVKAPPSVHALPDVLKQYRLGTKQLQVRQNMQPQSKKQLLYVLLDASGSMKESIMGTNVNGFLTRGHVASALSLAVIKKVLEEKSMLFFRFFAGSPDYLRKAKDTHDLADISRQIGLGDYNGGSTNIQVALTQAFKDIQKGKDEVLKAEVLLITDGKATLDMGDIKKAQKKTKLHVLEITSGARSTGKSTMQTDLQPVSETYIVTDPGNVDFSKIAKVV